MRTTLTEFNLRLETPPGSNLEYTRLKALEAARIARTRPEVAYTYTTVGGQSEAVDEATVFVKLTPKHERARRQQQISGELRTELGRVAGMTAFIGTGGFGGRKQIQLQLQGPDMGELVRLADRVAKVVREVPDAVDVGLSTKGSGDRAVIRELAYPGSRII